MGWNIVQESHGLCSQGRGARVQVRGVDRQTHTVIWSHGKAQVRSGCYHDFPPPFNIPNQTEWCAIWVKVIDSIKLARKQNAHYFIRECNAQQWFFKWGPQTSSICILGNLTEKQIPRPHSRSTKLETSSMGPGNLFQEPFRWFWSSSLRTRVIGNSLTRRPWGNS